MNNDIKKKTCWPPSPHLLLCNSYVILLHYTIEFTSSSGSFRWDLFVIQLLFCNRSSIKHDPSHPNSLEWAFLRTYIYESSHLLWLYVYRQSKCHSQTYRHERTHALITCTETHRNTLAPSLSLFPFISLSLSFSVSLPFSLSPVISVCPSISLSLSLSLFFWLCYLPVFVSLCPCYLPSSVCQSLSLSLPCCLS